MIFGRKPQGQGAKVSGANLPIRELALMALTFVNTDLLP